MRLRPRAEPRGTQRPGGSECERSGRPCRTERAKLHCGAVCRALNAVHDVCGPTELPALLSTQSVRPSVRPRWWRNSTESSIAVDLDVTSLVVASVVRQWV